MEQINATFLPANAASSTVCDRLWPMQLSCSTRNQQQATSRSQEVKPEASQTRKTHDAVAVPTQRWASRATYRPTLMSRLDDSSHRLHPSISTSASHTVDNVSVVVEASHGGVSHNSLRVCNKVQLTVCGGALPSQRLLASTLVNGVMDGFVHYPALTILNAKFTFDRVTEEHEADGDVRTVMYEARGRLDVRVHRLDVASRGEKLAEDTISLVAMFLACSIAADELQAATKAPPEKPPSSSSPPQGTCCPSGVTTKVGDTIRQKIL